MTITIFDKLKSDFDFVYPLPCTTLLANGRLLRAVCNSRSWRGQNRPVCHPAGSRLSVRRRAVHPFGGPAVAGACSERMCYSKLNSYATGIFASEQYVALADKLLACTVHSLNVACADTPRQALSNTESHAHRKASSTRCSHCSLIQPKLQTTNS